MRHFRNKIFTWGSVTYNETIYKININISIRRLYDKILKVSANIFPFMILQIALNLPVSVRYVFLFSEIAVPSERDR